ncbi:MAG: relaxase domain-containing protein [Acidimicrobiia bacterium]|nr:relaxase domain-containing protein [Acidimicrobiia bacterium]
MLSIARFGRGHAQYYLDGVARSDDYYATAGEAIGCWRGHGATRLGLSEAVAPVELRAVLDGRDPGTREPLGRRCSNRRSGFDLTFSAPKGVSLLGLVGTPEVQRQTLAAHRSAVDCVLGDMESRVAWVRCGANGVHLVRAEGLVQALFEHHTSRAGDPHLHSHVVIPNVAPMAEGRWFAPDGRALYAYVRTGGYLYQAALRAELTERLGLRWGPVRTGMAEPAVFSRSQLRAFSTRREQIEVAMEGLRGRSARASEVANLRTRQPKVTDVRPEIVHAAWEVRAEMAKIDMAAIARDFGPKRRRGFDVAELRAELCGPNGLTADRSSFVTFGVLRAVAERAPLGARPPEVDAAARAVVADREVVRLREGRWATEWFTTREVLAREHDLVRLAERADRETVRTRERALLGSRRDDGIDLGVDR